MHGSERKLGVIQSCYVPWRGYFDFIRSVDVFVIYDDVEFSSGGWRNRNRLKTESGLKWLTVPVVGGAGSLCIDEVRIGNARKPWRQSHEGLIKAALEGAAFFDDAIRLWREGVVHQGDRLSELNERMIRVICEYLGISTPIVRSRAYAPTGKGSARLLDLLGKLHADAYLSGPSADDYLDKDAFRRSGIRLEYKSYDYPSYPQRWGQFEGAVSILDLIANCGREGARWLRSSTPDRVVVEPCSERLS